MNTIKVCDSRSPGSICAPCVLNPGHEGEHTDGRGGYWPQAPDAAAPGPSPEFLHGQTHMQSIPDGHVPWLSNPVRPLGKIHELKTWPEHFMAVFRGLKTFEIRKDDRGFAVGDWLVLKEYIPRTGTYTGNELRARVVHLLKGPCFGLEAGHVVMSLYDVVAQLKTIPAGDWSAPAGAVRVEEPWSL